MKIEDLPEDWREWVHGLKHGSATIENDVDDALVYSKDLKEFKQASADVLKRLGMDVGDNLSHVRSMQTMLPNCRKCLERNKIDEKCENYVKRVIGECTGIIRSDGLENTKKKTEAKDGA